MKAIMKTAEPRATDRLVEALSTLAALLDRTINEIKTVESDFQSRIVQAVHDTETSLQQQGKEELQRAVEETDKKVRAEVTEQLTTHFEQKMTTAVERLRSEMEAERERLNRDLDRATQSAIKWEEERASLVGQCDTARQAAAEAKAAQERAEARTQAVEVAASQIKAVPTTGPGSPQVMEAEITRVEQLIKNISQLIDNPATELATVIRKNVERAELESYLKGIRFAYSGR
jgi:lipopolysaccharide biosynthesis regulator YciM